MGSQGLESTIPKRRYASQERPQGHTIGKARKSWEGHSQAREKETCIVLFTHSEARHFRYGTSFSSSAL